MRDVLRQRAARAADDRRPGRHRGMRGAALVAAGLLLVAAACGDDSGDAGDNTGTDGGAMAEVDDTIDPALAPDGFAPTADFLNDTADRSTTDPFRFEMWMSYSGEEPSGPPLATGRVHGELFAVEMDLMSMFALMGEALTGAFGEEGVDYFDEPVDDLDGFENGMPSPEQMEGMMPPGLEANATMEMVGDGTSTYTRNAMFLMFLLDPTDGATMSPDSWVRMDHERLAAEGADDLAGDQELQPDELIALVRQAANVRELGSSEVRGDPVTGLAADVAMGHLLEATAAGASDDLMTDVPVTLEVWVDREGYLRRISYSLDYRNLAETEGIDGPVPDLTISFTMEMFDYGQPVDIEIPTDSVDITDKLIELTTMASDLEDLMADFDPDDPTTFPDFEDFEDFGDFGDFEDFD